jgi:LacI family transcriptional regulator
MDRKIVTLEEVARHSGVSKSTASLVLRRSSLVSSKTAEKVWQAVKDTGYIYNRGAASLRSKSTNTVGFIVVDIENPFYASIFHGMEEVLFNAGFNLFVSSTSNIHEKQIRIHQTMMEQNVDGIFLCPSTGTTGKAIKSLQRYNKPHILVARYVANATMDYVGIDNLMGAKIAMEYFIEKGHRRIAFIACNTESSILRERLQGYHEMLAAHNLDAKGLELSCPMTFDGGKQAALRLFSIPDRPTAILCYNDIIAYGAILATEQLGLQAGKDISIIGADNSPVGSYCKPGISTISTQPLEIGAEAARLFLERLNGLRDNFKRIILSPRLIERESSHI